LALLKSNEQNWEQPKSSDSFMFEPLCFIRQAHWCYWKVKTVTADISATRLVL